MLARLECSQRHFHVQPDRHADTDCVYRRIIQNRPKVSRAFGYLKSIRYLLEAIRIDVRHGDDMSIGKRLERREMPLSSHAATSDQTYSYRFPPRCHIRPDQFLRVRS
jgi:hypothetical protein